MVHVRTAQIVQSDGATLSLTTKPSREAESRWFVEDVAGWYGGSGVRGDTTQRLGHGTFVSRGYREGRSLTVHGWVECADADIRDWQERNLSGVMWDGGWGTITCDDGNATLSTRVRLDGAPQIVKIGLTTLQFQIPLVSESPFLYGEEQSLTVYPPSFGAGFEIPPFARDLGKGPIITFGTEVQETAYIWNDGNADSAPVFTVIADTPAGFSVGLRGERVTYPWPTFKNAPITVDMAGAITVGGQDQTHKVGERGWTSVAPQSIETPQFRFLSGGSGWATVTFRDTYI